MRINLITSISEWEAPKLIIDLFDITATPKDPSSTESDGGNLS